MNSFANMYTFLRLAQAAMSDAMEGNTDSDAQPAITQSSGEAASSAAQPANKCKPKPKPKRAPPILLKCKLCSKVYSAGFGQNGHVCPWTRALWQDASEASDDEEPPKGWQDASEASDDEEPPTMARRE